MTKLEAVKNNYGSEIEFLDEGRGVPRFEDNGAIYAVYDEDELEQYTKEEVVELFNEGGFGEGKDLTDWVNKWGGIKEFYNEEYINDFRIEDSDTFAEMSDEEIIDYLTECGYFDEISKEQIDEDKIAQLVWDTDGAQILSGYDGELHYCNGYTVIREE